MESYGKVSVVSVPGAIIQTPVCFPVSCQPVFVVIIIVAVLSCKTIIHADAVIVSVYGKIVLRNLYARFRHRGIVIVIVLVLISYIFPLEVGEIIGFHQTRPQFRIQWFFFFHTISCCPEDTVVLFIQTIVFVFRHFNKIIKRLAFRGEQPDYIIPMEASLLCGLCRGPVVRLYPSAAAAEFVSEELDSLMPVFHHRNKAVVSAGILRVRLRVRRELGIQRVFPVETGIFIIDNLDCLIRYIRFGRIIVFGPDRPVVNVCALTDVLIDAASKAAVRIGIGILGGCSDIFLHPNGRHLHAVEYAGIPSFRKIVQGVFIIVVVFTLLLLPRLGPVLPVP